MPVVSVIIPSYNHEQFIEECIQSVLDQTYQDFEIIITDDGSSDGTVKKIEGFTDPRIKLYKFIENRGACFAANHCLLHAQGKYIAMLSSDDAWYPQKLEVQVKYLDEHPKVGAVFGRVDWVNESGELITNITFPYKNIFEVENRTRFEWLRYFFEKGNCLCHPCSLVRRECYSEVGMFNPTLAGVPDFDLWIRICLKYEIMILDLKLIRFRRISEKHNASGDNINTRVRNRFEYLQVLNHYLRIKDPDELLMIFPDAGKYGKVAKDLIPYFLGRIGIDTGLDYKMLWGVGVLYNILQDNKISEMLYEYYDFSFQDLIRLAGKCDVFRIGLISQYSNSPADLVSQPSDLNLGHRSVIRKLLSASKRYVKELYWITHGER